MVMPCGAVAVGHRLVIFKIEQTVALESRLIPERTRSKRPRRPLPHGVTPDFALDFVRCHARVVVPRRVVEPDVVEAEPQVFIQRRTRPWRTEFAHSGTAGMIAMPVFCRPVRVGMARAHGTWHDVSQ